MRLSDFLLEDDITRQAILDIVTIMAGEETHSLPIEAIQDELAVQGINISNNTLFDVIQTLAIVDNIKDDIVYFNTDGPAHAAGMSAQSSEVNQERVVSSMAQKQVDKGLRK